LTWIDVVNTERVGEHELTQRAFELRFRREPNQGQSLSKLHERMRSALDCALTTIASSRDAAHRSAAPRRGNSVTDLDTCAPSTALTTASVIAENEWSAVRSRTLRRPTMSPAIGNEMIWREPLASSLKPTRLENECLVSALTFQRGLPTSLDCYGVGLQPRQPL
jgi:hypothetical protein